VEFARTVEVLLEQTSEPEARWAVLRGGLRELAELPEGRPPRAAQLEMEQERWEREMERAETQEVEQVIKEMKKQALAPFWAALQMGTLAEAFGGGEDAIAVAAHILETAHILASGTLWKTKSSSDASSATAEPVSAQPDQGESNQIKVNQTESGPAGVGKGGAG
jgi:hypothetical protein